MNLPAAFDGRVLDLALERLLPTRSLPKEITRLRKYTQIMASMKEVGLIEPLSIMPGDPKTGMHMILDGHVRLRIARDLGWERIACIVARDDEGFTYNRRVNRLATIQEHFMILRALERGVQEAHLARALDVNIGTIRYKRNLLDGICPEVVELLKEQQFSTKVAQLLRKMKPARQIECAELMCSLRNFSISYAQALLAATPQAQMVEAERPKKISGLSAEQMARMEQEMSQVQSRFRAIEATYNTDVLSLVVARGYVAKLMGNKAVASYLRRHHADLAEEFQTIVASTSLDEGMVVG